MFKLCKVYVYVPADEIEEEENPLDASHHHQFSYNRRHVLPAVDQDLDLRVGVDQRALDHRRGHRALRVSHLAQIED